MAIMSGHMQGKAFFLYLGNTAGLHKFQAVLGAKIVSDILLCIAQPIASKWENLPELALVLGDDGI